jgi:four helix bundle protein
MIEAVKKTFAETYEDLDVYRRSFSLALIIHRKTLDFPKIEQYALADQLRRASKAVPANIAEGFGRQRNSRKEFARFAMIAASSSDETQVWLKFARELGYLTESEFAQWLDEARILSRMLQSLYTNRLSSHNRSLTSDANAR